MSRHYFYIDESGKLFDKKESIFIHGCIKTDTKNITQKILLELKENIKNHVYYSHYIEEFSKTGFHASDNHPDIRAELFKILPYMNFRVYFVILNKETEFYKNIKSEKNDGEIFEYSLKRLINNHIKITKGMGRSEFIFEETSVPNKSLKRILEEVFTDDKVKKCKCTYEIVPSTEENLAIIDYLNSMVFTILKEKNLKQRMEENFDLLKEKIGNIHILHNDTFLSRKGNSDVQVTVNNLKKYYHSGD